MKFIKIWVYDDTDTSLLILNLESKISASTKNTAEYATIFPQIISCIESFSLETKKLSKHGTTLHVARKFMLHNENIVITLQHPKKINFLNRMLSFFKE